MGQILLISAEIMAKEVKGRNQEKRLK